MTGSRCGECFVKTGRRGAGLVGEVLGRASLKELAQQLRRMRWKGSEKRWLGVCGRARIRSMVTDTLALIIPKWAGR